MIIDRSPQSLRAFFSPLRRQLSKPQFHHLWTITLTWIVNVGRSSVLNSAAHMSNHRTSVGRFLTAAPWNGADLLDGQVRRLLKRMKPRRGESIDLVIDDTRIAKRGRKMHAVAPIWVPTQKRFTYGNVVVTAAVVFRNVVLPWRFEVWVPKNEPVADIVRQHRLPLTTSMPLNSPKG